jgi:hypothetical protein
MRMDDVGLLSSARMGHPRALDIVVEGVFFGPLSFRGPCYTAWFHIVIQPFGGAR